jgi:hypothetical protein
MDTPIATMANIIHLRVTPLHQTSLPSAAGRKLCLPLTPASWIIHFLRSHPSEDKDYGRSEKNGRRVFEKFYNGIPKTQKYF